MSEQIDLLSWRPPEPPRFLGATFDAARDGKRLNEQSQRVHAAMIDGVERGLKQIAALTGDPEASVSARLRDLRRYGFTVSRRYVERGLWLYRVTK